MARKRQSEKELSLFKGNPDINKNSKRIAQKQPPIYYRYKQINELRNEKRKKLESLLTYEQSLKDPEGSNPRFRPDLQTSQSCVNKSYDEGFHSFLREMN